MKNFNKQKGYNLVQLGMYTILVSAGIAASAGVYQALSSDTSNTQALEEASTILNQMGSMGASNGHVYTGLLAADLIAETSIDDAVNVFGLTFSLAVATGDWELTYPFPDSSSCEWVESRIAGNPALNATAPACDVSNNLVATVE